MRQPVFAFKPSEDIDYSIDVFERLRGPRRQKYPRVAIDTRMRKVALRLEISGTIEVRVKRATLDAVFFKMGHEPIAFPAKHFYVDGDLSGRDIDGNPPKKRNFWHRCGVASVHGLKRFDSLR
jgi:hypothetical protein